MYYALTPGCIMAGGKLEITYTLSFLRGSIVVWADMLIGWAPFRYRVDMGICIRIEANIDMGLFTVRFNLEMGCELHLWGPPFAGEVYVDWCIFSFTIPFGPGKDEKPQNLEWDQFKKQFIPAKEGTQLRSTGNSNNKQDNKIYAAADIIIADGIINEPEKNGVKYTIVNPHKLSIRVEAPVPVTDASISGNKMADDAVMIVDNERRTYAKRNLDLGVRPMGVKKLSSAFNIAVDGVSGLEYDTYGCSVPEALWGQPQPAMDNNKPGQSKVLNDALKGIILRPGKVGIPDGTPQFDLNGKFSVIKRTLSWRYIPARTGPSNAAYGVKDLRILIVDKLEEKRNGERLSIIDAALKAQGVGGPAIDNEVQQWVSHFISEPVIVQLGGLPQYRPQRGK